MKFKTALLITLLCPLASHALVGGTMRGLKVDDCSKRTNSLGSQMSDLQGLVHKVALVGEESGTLVSNDPNDQDAIDEEASGYGRYCGTTVGALSYMEHNGKRFLIGTAHGFIKNGQLIECGEDFGAFVPDEHYIGNNSLDRKKSFKFKMPPLNKSILSKSDYNFSGKNAPHDIVILEIDDSHAAELATRQNGLGTRPVIKLADIAKKDLESLSQSTEVFMTGRRENFMDYRGVAIEKGCELNSLKNSLVLKTSCDAGPGSSGSQLKFKDQSGQMYSTGMVISGTPQNISQPQYKTTSSGNFFISSEDIIYQVEKVFND